MRNDNFFNDHHNPYLMFSKNIERWNIKRSKILKFTKFFKYIIQKEFEKHCTACFIKKKLISF